MNGHMSESTFQQWQQDYSKMVSDKLSPVWVKAMETASLGGRNSMTVFSLITHGQGNEVGSKSTARSL